MEGGLLPAWPEGKVWKAGSAAGDERPEIGGGWDAHQMSKADAGEARAVFEGVGTEVGARMHVSGAALGFLGSFLPISAAVDLRGGLMTVGSIKPCYIINLHIFRATMLAPICID